MRDLLADVRGGLTFRADRFETKGMTAEGGRLSPSGKHGVRCANDQCIASDDSQS